MLVYSFARAGIVLATYFALMAVIGTFWHGKMFSFKASICFVLGCALGGLIGTATFNINAIWGYIGIGSGIAIMYILFYTGIVPAIIRKIPESIRKVFRTIFTVAKYVLIVLAIILAVVLVLAFWI